MLGRQLQMESRMPEAERARDRDTIERWARAGRRGPRKRGAEGKAEA